MQAAQAQGPTLSHTQTAASAVAEHLSSPPTLTRIPLLRQRIQKERSSLQNSLSARAKEQVDSVREGLSGLREAKNAIEGVKEGMKEVEQNMGDPRGHIDGFGKLLEVSVIHRRFVQALEMVTSLRGMYTQLSHISDLLALDRASPLGPSPNLLAIHYHLTELETFRNETMAQAKRGGSSTAAKKTLEAYFERLGETVEAFEAHYFHLASELLPLARAGNANVAVRIAKIAEVEGARDQKAIAIKMVKKSGNLDVAARFKSLQAEARVIKHYRAKVMDKIRESCRTAIEKSYAKHGDNGVAWLDDLDWIFDDLQLVDEELVPMFPPDWNIGVVYMKAYHKALYDFLATWVKSGPDAGSLLRLAQYTKEYKTTVLKEMGVPEDLVTPPLLDGKEQDLIEQYFKMIVKKMDEWSANLMKTEVAEFKTREQPPEIDADGFYGMQGAVILFQMLNQQVDLALDSNQGLILARVVEEANRVMRDIQAQWLKILEADFKKQVEKPEEVPGGLVEYVMALANDQIKSADFTEALNNRLEPLVSAKYKTIITDKLNDAMDGYLDVAKKCVQVLIDVVFNDLKPATKTLLTQSWYTEDPMTQIIETLKDYMVEDYQTHLNPNLFDLLIEDIIDTFLITYLTAIRRSPKLRIPQSIDRMRRDIDVAFDFFSVFKPRKELEAYFDVLESVLTLVSASKMMVFLDYWPFRKKFGPNLAFVEALMKARDDLDRSAVSDIMESVKRKVNSEIVAEPEVPSIFTRLPAKTPTTVLSLARPLGAEEPATRPASPGSARAQLAAEAQGASSGSQTYEQELARFNKEQGGAHRVHGDGSAPISPRSPTGHLSKLKIVPFLVGKEGWRGAGGTTTTIQPQLGDSADGSKAGLWAKAKKFLKK
ncbi:exocyst complex component sec6 [Pseudohyphozyma bogoriensis]|nr:exocyst complex component sec6 [Pseudohyphozyma bogoriensis]